MDKELEINLFNFLKDPSILGGPDTYRGEAVKQKYPAKYVSYIQKNRNIPLEIFYDDKKYLYHMRIVSENKDDVYYDVLIELSTDDKTKEASPTIANYEKLRFFSNTPRFTFTFAYVFNKYKIIISELKDKFDDITFQEPPKKTNSKMAIGYDSTIFMAIYFLKANSFYLRKADIKRHGKPISNFNPDEVANSHEVLEKRTAKNLSLIASIKSKTTQIVRNTKRTLRSMINKIPSALRTTPFSKIVNKKAVVKGTKKARIVRPRGKK